MGKGEEAKAIYETGCHGSEWKKGRRGDHGAGGRFGAGKERKA